MVSKNSFKKLFQKMLSKNDAKKCCQKMLSKNDGKAGGAMRILREPTPYLTEL